MSCGCCRCRSVCFLTGTTGSVSCTFAHLHTNTAGRHDGKQTNIPTNQLTASHPV
ncbi:hypothetical protein BO70DRAFT_364671 [Aspergillus heteromorphus CBS 117.55]|uniref:Uncharacterized protein n=1 Tax=Aspergillus heteromorphus CBS 117.55 TaxID=1448321 RepID=A0A317VG35_9EURO|nr:uncharacterized protein BO70DRAFT_364671 [Aspergillus heteromorphus CBS 117.55]PWY72895.1 hypothetical protein BO70DRAFT_364671 [Aspergillus heteromorphus CBS 117.55]